MKFLWWTQILLPITSPSQTWWSLQRIMLWRCKSNNRKVSLKKNAIVKTIQNIKIEIKYTASFLRDVIIWSRKFIQIKNFSWRGWSVEFSSPVFSVKLLPEADGPANDSAKRSVSEPEGPANDSTIRSVNDLLGSSTIERANVCWIDWLSLSSWCKPSNDGAIESGGKISSIFSPNLLLDEIVPFHLS